MNLEEYHRARQRFYEREGYYPSVGQLKNYLEGYYFAEPQSNRERREDEAPQPMQQIIPRSRRRPWK